MASNLESRIESLVGKQILMLSPVNFTRAYSSFQYLAQALMDCDATVDIMAALPIRDMQKAKDEMGSIVHSYRANWLGRIPKAWKIAYHLQFRRAVKKNPDGLILYCIHPNNITPEIVKWKTANPDKKLILYCPELWIPTDPIKLSQAKIDYFKKHISLADLVIDVDTTRAELRSQHFNIGCRIPVLPNTMPLHSLPPKAKEGKLMEKVGIAKDCKKKKLLFTGQARPHTIKELISIFRSVDPDIVLIWFIHGDADAAAETQAEMDSRLGIDRVRVHHSLKRTELLSLSGQANAGLIVYPCRNITTANQKYASPSKLYEFLANGLPVVSYPNPSIKTILEEYDIGECPTEEDPQQLASAINSLFDRSDFQQLRTRCHKVFQEELCHEIASTDALQNIVRLILN